MPLVKTTAITLKSRKWGEADRIVTLYAKQLGKIRAVARGARRLKSRLGAALEPLTLSELNLFEKSGDSLYRVSQVDLVEPFIRFREDLTLMAAAARMANVVGAVTPDGDPDPELFNTLEQGLRSMVTSDDPAFTALLFQIRLLGLTGFRPQTDQCAACGKTRVIQGTAVFPCFRRTCLYNLRRAATVPMLAVVEGQFGVPSTGVAIGANHGDSTQGRRPGPM